MYKLVKPLLFKFDPEKIHHFIFKFLKIFVNIPIIKQVWKNTYTIEHPNLEREVFGIKFKNPVGLAAGFDKDAKLYKELSSCGFGFIEIGTITPKPQIGNPKKRLFRLPKDKALINRMGFNNEGIDKAIERLKTKPKDLIIGGNIGKNKITPNESAMDDYTISFEKLFPYVDYFVVNVSSPNTPNLRALQEKAPLTALLNGLQSINKAKANPKPILLKIAPDLTNEQLDDIIEIIDVTKIDGIIATNTTIDRSNLSTETSKVEQIGAGGLSGKPLKDKSTEIIKYLHQKSNGSFPIIGVGGIHSPEDAIEKINAGASLVQIYTGFIYEGPSLVKKICKKLITK